MGLTVVSEGVYSLHTKILVLNSCTQSILSYIVFIN